MTCVCNCVRLLLLLYVCAAVLEMRLNCWQLRKSLPAPPRHKQTSRGLSGSRGGSRAPSSIQYQISGLPYAHSLCATFLSPFDFLPFFPLQSYTEHTHTHNFPTDKKIILKNANIDNNFYVLMYITYITFGHC